MLLSTAEVGRGTESMFQAREAASERPQMLPKMIGDHLAVRVNSVSGCHRLMAPHTVQSDRIENQRVVSQAVSSGSGAHI